MEGVAGLAKKVRTLRHVGRRYGAAGIRSVLRDKVRPFTEPVTDYAKLLPAAAMLLARYGRPARFFNAVGAGIGDDLLLTAVFRELQRRGRGDFWVRTSHPELYLHNDDVSVVVPPLERFDRLVKRVGTSVVYPWYTSYHPAFDRDDPTPEQHLISIMCQKAGITGTITLRPYLHLTAVEKRRGVTTPRQVAIMSSGLDAKHAMRNKNWPLEKYQGVVSALSGRYDFVQIGSRHDPPLHGAMDLRGRTSLRETAAVLGGSLAFVGQVGFLMHLARAVDCRAVIVYGGRETPAQSGYRCNENLYSAVPCSPCWRLNTCPYDRMCLAQIEVHDVIEALERQVLRADSPLEEDSDTITDELIARNAQRYEQAVVAHELAWAALYK